MNFSLGKERGGEREREREREGGREERPGREERKRIGGMRESPLLDPFWIFFG